MVGVHCMRGVAHRECLYGSEHTRPLTASWLQKLSSLVDPIYKIIPNTQQPYSHILTNYSSNIKYFIVVDFLIRFFSHVVNTQFKKNISLMYTSFFLQWRNKPMNMGIPPPPGLHSLIWDEQTSRINSLRSSRKSSISTSTWHALAESRSPRRLD